MATVFLTIFFSSFLVVADFEEVVCFFVSLTGVFFAKTTFLLSIFACFFSTVCALTEVERRQIPPINTIKFEASGKSIDLTNFRKKIQNESDLLKDVLLDFDINLCNFCKTPKH